MSTKILCTSLQTEASFRKKFKVISAIVTEKYRSKCLEILCDFSYEFTAIIRKNKEFHLHYFCTVLYERKLVNQFLKEVDRLLLTKYVTDKI